MIKRNFNEKYKRFIFVIFYICKIIIDVFKFDLGNFVDEIGFFEFVFYYNGIVVFLVGIVLVFVIFRSFIWRGKLRKYLVFLFIK